MEKLRFDFKMKSSSDGKSTILCVTSISTSDGRTFAIPEDLQNIASHKELQTTQTVAKIRNSLKKRGQYRKIWISLTDTLSKVYLDEEENVQFENQYLEEITEKETEHNVSYTTDETIKKLLERILADKEQKSEIQNLSKIAKDFTIDKFDGKNSNASQWIEEFQTECERCMVTEDRKKIEMLKFFAEKSAADWYSCMILKFTVESLWKDWKENFVETFGNKGWSPIKYAFAFHYQNGSLLEYALKKEKLLLQIRKTIDKQTLVDLIAIGLPNYVIDRIDRETIKETQDLYNEISRLEHLTRKNATESKPKMSYNKEKRTEEKKPCQICENAKRGKRYHPESNCWFKEKNKKNEPLKTVNNSELETDLNMEDPKN